VAQRFRERGAEVWVSSRHPAEGANLFLFEAEASTAIPIPPGALVLHSIPVLESPDGPRELTEDMLRRFTKEPARMVYLSTTGVYGAQRDVDENTVPAPLTERETLRVKAEEAVRRGPWSSLILRPAAIYGPGRGIQVSLREGRYQLAGDGNNFVSRIHVDDLAAHVEAALLADLTGAYPVADELPCTSREIAEFCSRLLGVPMPPRGGRASDRRVDGRAIRERLGITLRYPSYREGIPASL